MCLMLVREAAHVWRNDQRVHTKRCRASCFGANTFTVGETLLAGKKFETLYQLAPTYAGIVITTSSSVRFHRSLHIGQGSRISTCDLLLPRKAGTAYFPIPCKMVPKAMTQGAVLKALALASGFLPYAQARGGRIELVMFPV